MRCSPFDEYKVWKRQVDNKTGLYLSQKLVSYCFSVLLIGFSNEKLGNAGEKFYFYYDLLYEMLEVCWSVLLNFNFLFKFVEKGTQRLNTLIKTLLLRRTKDQTCPSTGLHLVRFLDASLLHLLLCNGIFSSGYNCWLFYCMGKRWPFCSLFKLSYNSEKFVSPIDGCWKFLKF